MRRTRVRQKVWPVRHRTTITRRSFANELDWAAGPADRTDSARSMVAGSVRRTGGVSEKLQVRDGWLECRRPSGSRHECARHARTLSRSEEHTSELQSLMRSSYAVFCLKKKTKR